MEYVAAILTAASLFMFLLYAIRGRALRPSEVRLRYLAPREERRRETTTGLLRRAPAATPMLGRLLDRNGLAERWTAELERADLTMRPSEYLLMRLLLAAVGALLIAALGRNIVAVVIALVVGAMLYKLPALWVSYRVKRRLAKLDAQLVETITLIAGALRSGFAFAQGVDVAAKRVGPPMSVELNRLLLDISLGASTESALAKMNERIGSEDMDIVVTAIMIQRNTGGNLAEVLDSVTETMRDRERLHGEIKTLTSQQRLTGWILSVWPILLGAFFFLINPSAMSLMFTTALGVVMLITFAVLNVLGFFTIQRILDIDI